MNNILITGARSAVALDLARDFKYAGYNVHMADCSSAYIAKLSHVPDRVHHYASPVYNPEKFRADIENLMDIIDPVLIIPTCEEVFHLAQPLLSKVMAGKLFSPSFSQLHILHEKSRFIKFCRDVFIDVPKTYRLENKTDIDAYRENSEKWVFKPCYSRFGSRAVIAPDSKKFEKISSFQNNPWVAQEYIAGSECSFYAIAKNGELVAFSAYQSAWRIAGGASYVFEAVSATLSEKIKIIARKIAKSLILTGQFSCDLIVDHNGSVWPIECNPRSTSGLHLLAGKGELATSIVGSSACITNQENKTKHMLPMMLTYGLSKSVRQANYLEWYKILKNFPDVIGNKHDRLPAIGAVIDTLIFAAIGFKRGQALSQATTNDIEWNGEGL